MKPYSHSTMKANTSPGSSASFVQVLSHEFNPAISIEEISTALIWDLLSQLVKELFNYDFLTILRRKNEKRKAERRE